MRLSQDAKIWPRFTTSEQYRAEYESVHWIAEADLQRAMYKAVSAYRPGALREALQSIETAVSTIVSANSEQFVSAHSAQRTTLRPTFDAAALATYNPQLSFDRFTQVFAILFGDEDTNADDTFAFARLTRLVQREQLFDEQVAARCVTEYKRFLLLAAVNRFMVSPSTIVDEPWHAHQADFGDAYARCCVALFGRYLRHLPALAEEDEHGFQEQYARTVALYRAVFSNEPAQEFWPMDTTEGPEDHVGCEAMCSLTKRWRDARELFGEFCMNDDDDDDEDDEQVPNWESFK